MKLLSIDKVGEEILARFPEILRIKAEANPKTFQKIVPIILEHIATYGEVRALAEAGEYDYFFETPTYSAQALLWKDERDPALAIKKIEKVLSIIESVDAASFTPDAIKDAIWPYATEVGRGSVLWPLRYALSGREKSPDPFTLVSVLEKSTTIERLKQALGALRA